MTIKAILMSGPIGTGKTATAEALSQALDADIIRVRTALADVLGIKANDRRTLQIQGADLDRRTNGGWLRDYLETAISETARLLVVDSLRTRLQTTPILDALVDSRLVFLAAHESTRRRRYAKAAAIDPVKASTGFDAAMHHPTETEVEHLRPMAHLVIETDELSAADVAQMIVDGWVNELGGPTWNLA